jgi:hypothetical protein
MAAKYIIRLDDASEYMDYDKWNPYFELFDKYNIKPIIAVIPFNKDPKMIIKNLDNKFWDRVRLWQQKEYRIALHGYEHLYTNPNSGIIGLNKFSEFAGVPLRKQIEMLTKASKKFEDERIETNIFVSPAHSFDINTLIALKQATCIKYISDGFFLNPIQKDGFNWIPQQLWEPKIKSKGVWTICYHPETSDNSVISSLEFFLRNHSKYIVDPLSLDFKHIKFEDILFTQYMGIKIGLHRIVNSFVRLYNFRFIR